MSDRDAPSLTEISVKRLSARRCERCGRDHWNDDSGSCDICRTYEVKLAGQALDALGHLSAVWHNRFSTEEISALCVLRDALRREARA